MIWHLHIACACYRVRHADASLSASAKSRRAVAWPPRAPKSVGIPRISSPADVEALTVSSRSSGRDSDLEAFSHNPSDGSLAPLAYQPST